MNGKQASHEASCPEQAVEIDIHYISHVHQELLFEGMNFLCAFQILHGNLLHEGGSAGICEKIQIHRVCRACNDDSHGPQYLGKEFKEPM